MNKQPKPNKQNKQLKTTKPEIMAPVGSYEALAVAIKAGADSIYFGIDKLNMRAGSAKTFKLNDLKKIAEICKKNKTKSYLTLNTIMYDEDIKTIKKIIDTAKSAKISAIIAMDMAVIEYAKKIGMRVHMSTQTNISNIQAVKFYSKFAEVIVLARELSLKQIKQITSQIKKQKIKGPSGELIKIEVFIHGALCVSISGKCYMSLALYNKSANRGECLQTCRRKFKVTDAETGDKLKIENNHIMSPKDLCTIKNIPELIKAGISVFKIEGRGRSPDYVFTVVNAYRQAVDLHFQKKLTKKQINKLEKQLKEVFNRGFWHGGYYLGEKLGEWSGTYGSKATIQKHFIGLVKHYYPKKHVAEIIIQKEKLAIGDNILITGNTTGVLKTKVESLYADDKPAKTAKKPQLITITVPEKVRKNDKIYVLKKRKKLQNSN